jgi:hypothetical protein
MPGRAAAILVLTVAACTMFQEEEPPPPCPRISIRGDAATITKFRPGPGRDLTDVLYEGVVTNVTGRCTYANGGKGANRALSMKVVLVIEAARGPANRDGRAAFSYFVGITDSSRNVLNKERFNVRMLFPGNRTRLVITDDPVTLEIPVKAGQSGRDFTIFVGFQLSREDLEYNRRARKPIR